MVRRSGSRSPPARSAKPYELVYLRDGEKKTTTIVRGSERRSSSTWKARTKAEEDDKRAEPAKTAINAFGLEVQPLTPELAKPLGLPAGLKGVIVSSVKEGSPGRGAGIQEGDVITKVIRDHKLQPLTSVKEFQDLASKSDELAIYVQTRRGSARFVVLSKDSEVNESGSSDLSLPRPCRESSTNRKGAVRDWNPGRPFPL